jgi:salicylate hydroxylase
MALLSDKQPILIAGGGIGGLAVAFALARQNFPVRVFEQAAEFREVGAGIQLGPNIFRVLDTIGLKDQMLADAWQPDKLEMRDALTCETITTFPLGERFLQRFAYPYAVTHRADIHAVFLDACRAHDLISLETNRRVVDFKDMGNSVTLWLDNREEVKGAALIGCDGLWSCVRAKLVNDGEPRLSGHIAYRAVLKREEVPSDLWRPDVILWAGPQSDLVHYPLRRGTLYNLVAVFHSNRYREGWNLPGDPDELWKHFSGQRSEVLRLLECVKRWNMWVMCDREPVKNWSRGRVTLLGDAAHPMLQYLSQGACMAVEDAVTLASMLAAMPDDIPGAFQTYQDERYLRTGRVQLMSRVYGQVFHAEGVAAELRYELLRPRTPEQAYDDGAWLYGGPDLS